MKSLMIRIIVLFTCVIVHQTQAGDFSINRRIVTRPRMWSQQEFFLYTQLDDGSISLFAPSIAYGTTETTGFQMSLPIILHEHHDKQTFRGLSDMSFIGQWQFYRKPSNLALFAGGVVAPTRTYKRNPAEIRQPGGYTFELAYIHSSEDWFAQINSFCILTPKKDARERSIIATYYVGAGPKMHFKRGSLFTTLSARGLESSRGVSRILLGPQFAYIYHDVTIGSSLEFPIMEHRDNPFGPRVEWICAFLVQFDF
jgi:hypothetical protein